MSDQDTYPQQLGRSYIIQICACEHACLNLVTVFLCWCKSKTNEYKCVCRVNAFQSEAKQGWEEFLEKLQEHNEEVNLCIEAYTAAFGQELAKTEVVSCL